MKQSIECPRCGSADLAIERRPDGNAGCGKCGWNGPYKECFFDQQPKPKLKTLLAKTVRSVLAMRNDFEIATGQEPNFEIKVPRKIFNQLCWEFDDLTMMDPEKLHCAVEPGYRMLQICGISFRKLDHEPS